MSVHGPVLLLLSFVIVTVVEKDSNPCRIIQISIDFSVQILYVVNRGGDYWRLE